MLYYSAFSLTQENYVEPASKGPGIYLDSVGSLKLIDGFLNVIIPADISFYQPHLENINGVIGTARYLCKQSDVFRESECHNMIQPLSTRYNDITKNFKSISHLMSNKKSKRSAWFGGVGTVFKHLFGTMDQNDAIMYNNAIHTVQTDEKELAKLVKNNILITTSTLSSFKEIINKLSTYEQSLNSAIETLIMHSKEMSTVTNKLLIRSKMLELLNILENSLLALSFKLEDILNAIMFSKVNILNTNIITPDQLYIDLVENYRFLPKSKELPVSLVLDNIHILLNVSEIASYYTDNKIVFVLKIPLVNPNEYNLYQSVPFPMAHNISAPNSYSVIIPSTKYIGITRDKSHYCKLDHLKECRVIYSRFYLCINDVYSTSSTPICESEIITKVLNTVPKQCETKFLHGNIEIWQQLQNNKWIFVMSQKSKLSVDCQNGQNSEIDIFGTGILTLPNTCTGYCKDSILTPRFDTFVESRNVEPSSFDLINDSCCNYEKFKQIQSHLPPLDVKNSNLDSIFKQNSIISNNLMKDLDQIIEKPHIIAFGNYYSSTIIIVVIIIIVYLFYKIVRLSKCQTLLKSISYKNNDVKTSEIELDQIPAPLPRLRSSET